MVINCQSASNVEVGVSGLVAMETWLTGGISEQVIFGDVTPAGYSFHHVAGAHRKAGGVGLLILDSLKIFN